MRINLAGQLKGRRTEFAQYFQVGTDIRPPRPVSRIGRIDGPLAVLRRLVGWRSLTNLRYPAADAAGLTGSTEGDSLSGAKNCSAARTLQKVWTCQAQAGA